MLKYDRLIIVTLYLCDSVLFYAYSIDYGAIKVVWLF